MQLLELTLPNHAENLALDEALFSQSEQNPDGPETLRLWQFTKPVVVIGRASKVDVEVNRSFCEEQQIPVFRRCSGGTAVTVGPGCLLYSLILSKQQRPELAHIDEAHRLVMESLGQSLSQSVPDVSFQGTCDLTYQGRKFSGNSLRVGRHWLLYHGTILYDFPLDLLHDCLGWPPRQPEYRDERPHRDFVANLPLDKEQLTTAIENAFDVREQRSQWPQQLTKRLTADRYALDDWNFRL